MSHGFLSSAQKEVLAPFVKGHVVHDFGAGPLLMTTELVALGARKVIAVDKSLPVQPSTADIVLREGRFENWFDPTKVAFVSWPINDEESCRALVRICERASTVVYLGKNTDGCACASLSLLTSFLYRDLLAYAPDGRNCLIVLGGFLRDQRAPTGEEWAGINDDVMWSFEEAELASKLESRQHDESRTQV